MVATIKYALRWMAYLKDEAVEKLFRRIWVSGRTLDFLTVFRRRA